MDKVITEALQHLGLSQKEIKFMTACYMLGPSPIADIIKYAKLERSTAYLLATDLLAKNVITEDFKNYKKILTAVPPRTLHRMLAQKVRTIGRKELELKEQLARLEGEYKTSEIKPHVRVFQGVRGVHAVWEDVLSTNNEILLWTNQKTERMFFSEAFHEKFIKERINKRIPIRVLAVNNIPGKTLQEKDEKSLRHSKLLPAQITFSAETYIYDTKVAMLDYTKDIIGIIIESEPMASSQKAMFEMMWNMIP